MPRIIKPAKGTFTSSTVTIDSSGRVIAASSGAGAANMSMRLTVAGPSATNYTSPSNASKAQVILLGGGGGGGGSNNQTAGVRQSGGTGGDGGFGFYALDIDASTSFPYSIGAGGNGGPAGVNGVSGSAGGTSSFHNVSAAGGNGGQGRNEPGPGGSPGNTGAAPGAQTTIANNNYLFGGDF